MFTSRPNWPTCNVCGQQFSRHSLPIHREQCIRKYQQRLLYENLGYSSSVTTFGNREKRAVVTTSSLQLRSTNPLKKCVSSVQATMIKSKRKRSHVKDSKISDNRPLNSKFYQGSNTKCNFSLEENPNSILSLRECQFCHRSFSFDRIKKHESVCIERKGKRRCFNSTKQRLDGMDILPIYTKYNTKSGNRSMKMSINLRNMKQPFKPKSDWRRQHQDFQQAIREAKILQQQSMQKEYELAFSKSPQLTRIDHPLSVSRSGLTAAIPSGRSSTYRLSNSQKANSKFYRPILATKLSTKLPTQKRSTIIPAKHLKNIQSLSSRTR